MPYAISMQNKRNGMEFCQVPIIWIIHADGICLILQNFWCFPCFFFKTKCECGAIVVFHTDSDWGDAYSGKLIWFEFSWRPYAPAILPTDTIFRRHFIVYNSDVMAHVFRLNCECHNIWHHINMHPFFSKRVPFLKHKTKILRRRKKCVFFCGLQLLV